MRMSVLLTPSTFTVKAEAVKSIILMSASPSEQKKRGACYLQVPVITSPFSEKSCKRVVFCEQVMIHYTLSRKDILPEEKRATWFSTRELRRIAQSCLFEIHKLNRGQRLKDKKYCGRGLESETKDGLRAKRMNRYLARKIVLEEQDRQRREGVQEPDSLAYLYHSATSSCQVWANAVGLSDQRAAEDALETAITVKYDNHRPASGWTRQGSRTLSRSSLSWNRNIELARAA